MKHSTGGTDLKQTKEIYVRAHVWLLPMKSRSTVRKKHI